MTTTTKKFKMWNRPKMTKNGCFYVQKVNMGPNLLYAVNNPLFWGISSEILWGMLWEFWTYHASYKIGPQMFSRDFDRISHEAQSDPNKMFWNYAKLRYRFLVELYQFQIIWFEGYVVAYELFISVILAVIGSPKINIKSCKHKI